MELGGVIFMRPGQQCELQTSGLCEGVCLSLRVAHAAGILHCDLRASNVLHFAGAGYQLIDFGLSCSIEGKNNAPYELHSRGSQAAAVGPRVRELFLTDDQVVWTVADDYEMMLGMLGHFVPES
jgi:serine/threonine protein kinase